MLKNINTLGFYVSDLGATTNFYSKLGFQKIREGKTIAEMVLGSMKLQFIDKQTAKEQDESFQKEAFGEPKGTGLYINIEVEGIDAYFQDLKNKGLKPSTEPRDWPWGQREFVIRDPDRYKLVFYEKLK
jgi:uncharacterized glyoxalase superfamily protein PhnB